MAYWIDLTGGQYYSQAGQQDGPAIVQLAGGGEFVAWVDYGSPGIATAPVIYGKSLNSAGAQQGGDIALTGPLQAGSSNTVRLVATADGGFDAFWNESTPVNKLVPQQTTYAGRHFDASGNPLGAEFAVNPDLVYGFDFNFRAIALASGNILVSWGQANPSYRIVTPDGVPVTDVRTLDSPAQLGGLGDIVAAKDGGFYIAWSTMGSDNICHTYFEKFDANGLAQGGGPHVVINYPVLNETHIAELADGNVVVTATGWDSATNQDTIYAGEFTPDGHTAGSRGEQIAIPAGQRSYMHEVTALPDGGFYISWAQETRTSDGGFAYDGKLFEQRYDSSFTPVQQAAGQFVGDTGSGYRFSTVARADGAPAFAWTWSNPDDAGDIHARTFTNAAVPGATVSGTPANDALSGTSGDDTVDGNAGIDTLSYPNVRAHYNISRTADAVTVLGDDGNSMQTDTLRNVERLHFSDLNVALDVDGNAGEAYRLYQAAFNRGPDLPGLGFHIHDLDRGVPLAAVAEHFLESPEFQSHYGSLDDQAFITQLYANVLHRSPDDAGLAFHMNDLAMGVSRAYVLVHFSESPENQAALVGVIENGMPYIPQ